jgi:hypothetical protein
MHDLLIHDIYILNHTLIYIMGGHQFKAQRSPEQAYPQFVGIGLGICNLEGSGEVALTPRQSALVLASVACRPHVSLEGRHYFGDPHIHKGGFASLRIGSSGNIGAAIGAKAPGITIKVGGYQNMREWRNPNLTPFVGVQFGFDADDL